MILFVCLFIKSGIYVYISLYFSWNFFIFSRLVWLYCLFVWPVINSIEPFVQKWVFLYQLKKCMFLNYHVFFSQVYSKSKAHFFVLYFAFRTSRFPFSSSCLLLSLAFINFKLLASKLRPTFLRNWWIRRKMTLIWKDKVLTILSSILRQR